MRPVSTFAPQALILLNGPFMQEQSKAFAVRVLRDGGKDRAKQVEQAYRLALARPPTAGETQVMLDFLQRESLEQMCRVIFNLNEFAYVD